MPVCNKRSIQLLPKRIVLNPKDGPQWHNEIIAPGKRPDKYQLNLWRANEIIFMEAGVKPENIHTTNICTMCNHEYLFSHRKVGNERGNMGAFLGFRSCIF